MGVEYKPVGVRLQDTYKTYPAMRFTHLASQVHISTGLNELLHYIVITLPQRFM